MNMKYIDAKGESWTIEKGDWLSGCAVEYYQKNKWNRKRILTASSLGLIISIAASLIFII